MSKVLLSLVSVILAVVFFFSVVLFALFPFDNFNVRSQTLDIQIESISTMQNNPSFDYEVNLNEYYKYSFTQYNWNGQTFEPTSIEYQTNVHLYNKFNIESLEDRVYMGITAQFTYSNVDTTLEFLSNGFNTAVYLIYDITAYTRENLPIDNYVLSYHNYEYYLFDFLFEIQYAVNNFPLLNNENLVYGYLLPVVDTLAPTSSQINFSVLEFVNVNSNFPSLASVESFPLSSFGYSSYTNIDNLETYNFMLSYSTPIGNIGYMPLEVGLRSYIGNVSTVLFHEFTNLKPLEDMFGITNIDDLTDILDVVKNIFDFPVIVVRYGYQILIAFTYNLILL